MPGALLAAADGVALRTFEREDVPFVQRANANPELRVPIGSAPKRQDELEEWLLDGETDRFVVCRADDPAPGQPEDPDRIGAVSIETAPTGVGPNSGTGSSLRHRARATATTARPSR
jgi:ribosomal-protein-alanine N-acetyltransferase